MHSIKNHPAWLKSSENHGRTGATIRLARLLMSTSAHNGTASTLAGVLTGVTIMKYKATNGSDRSWHFTRVATAGPVQFTSAPGNAALAAADGIPGVTQVQADDGTGKNLAVYQIDLGVQ